MGDLEKIILDLRDDCEIFNRAVVVWILDSLSIYVWSFIIIIIGELTSFHATIPSHKAEEPFSTL